MQKNVAEIRCQFHQHFYIQIFRTNVVLAVFSSYMYVEKRRSYEKFVRLTLMKLTQGSFFELAKVLLFFSWVSTMDDKH